MSNNVRKRVLNVADGEILDGMDVDSAGDKEGRVLRARRSLPALSSTPTSTITTKSTTFGSSTKPPTTKQNSTNSQEIPAHSARRHSSRVESIIADKKLLTNRTSSATPEVSTRPKRNLIQPKSIILRTEPQKPIGRNQSGKGKDVFTFKESDSSSSDTDSGSSSASSDEDSDSSDDDKPEIAPGSQVLKKKWATHGLYVGQDMHIKGRSTLKGMKGSREVKKEPLPLPMYKGMQIMDSEKDFILPFGIFNLTPWVIPKPPGWKSLKRNVFCGDAFEIYKRHQNFTKRAMQSTVCACAVATGGCDSNCLNRIMYYECDKSNCALEDCANRPFRDLAIRVENDTWFNDGIEIVLTSDKGYGLRAVRSFGPNQVIVEYCGEIITQEECDDRLNKIYKDNESFYLMEFDNSMIIDATRGSVARFVNHSCNPNCKMEKWMVEGKPRMALFAGDLGIEVGEELTYDYNFNWFSGVSSQVCRCGARNCRGSLGKRSDGKKASSDDDDSTGRGRGHGKGSKPKKVIRKKIVKASNARIIKNTSKVAGKTNKITQVNPPNKSKAVALDASKKGRLSSTTIEKQSQRTVDKKESTTISLKKTKSKVFKVTKTYSKKEVTNSQVVKKTLVEEQPIKKASIKQPKKSVATLVTETLKPKTYRNTIKPKLYSERIQKAAILAEILDPTIPTKPKKINLICNSPGSSVKSSVTKKPVKSLRINGPTVGKATTSKNQSASREWSIESKSDTEMTKAPIQKKAKPQKPTSAPSRALAKKQAAKSVSKATKKTRGIPPPATAQKQAVSQPELDDNDDGAYETEVDFPRAKLKTKATTKKEGKSAKSKTDDERTRRKRGRPRGCLGKKSDDTTAPTSKRNIDSDLVYPCSASIGGVATSINTGTFYGLTGGVTRTPAYEELLYQRPVMPSLHRAIKRSRDDNSIDSSETYRRPGSDDTPLTELTNSIYSETEEIADKYMLHKNKTNDKTTRVPPETNNMQDLQASKRQRIVRVEPIESLPPTPSTFGRGDIAQ